MHIQIPGYSIVSTLSRGALATVYLACDIRTERELALKVIPLGDGLSPPEDLLLERERLLDLVHPNIVTLYDMGVYDGYYFLAMQYLPGYNLNHKRFELDFLTRLRVIADVAHALDFAATRACVHAMLNPNSIMVSEQSHHAVVLGFGMAGAIKNAPVVLTDAHFFSPEQLQGRALDHRSDLYSLGVILFLLLTDELPFQAASMDELKALDRTSLPQLPDYLQAFQPIINRLLNDVPESRYQSARECLADLGALPESAIITAVEGIAHLLVRESESPLEAMAKVVPFTAYDLFTSRAAEQNALIESDTSIIVPNKLLRSLDVAAEHEPSIPLRLISLLVSYKYPVLIAVFVVAALLIYWGVIKKGAPPSVREPLPAISPLTEMGTGLMLQEESFSLMSSPNLEEQAQALLMGIDDDFSTARDLVVVYRAALRGEDAHEHAFAKAGLENLQFLFSERIRLHLREGDQEAALRKRNLAEQLYHSEELLPVLTETFSALE